MQTEIASRLMTMIYYPISAVVSASASGRVLDLLLFDTLYCEKDLRVSEEAEEIWLVTNHPDGCPELYEADRKNLERLRILAGRRRVCVYIANEDSGVTQVCV